MLNDKRQSTNLALHYEDLLTKQRDRSNSKKKRIVFIGMPENSPSSQCLPVDTQKQHKISKSPFRPSNRFNHQHSVKNLTNLTPMPVVSNTVANPSPFNIKDMGVLVNQAYGDQDHDATFLSTGAVNSPLGHASSPMSTGCMSQVAPPMVMTVGWQQRNYPQSN